jgi:hypothetical protein
VLKAFLEDGVERVRLYEREDHNGHDRSRLRKRGVAFLVMITFSKRIPGPEYVVHHRDWDPRNCRLSNLEWRSRGLILQGAYERGLKTPTMPDTSGAKNAHAKLTWRIVRDMRRRVRALRRELATEYRVPPSTVRLILNRERWARAKTSRILVPDPPKSNATASRLAALAGTRENRRDLVHPSAGKGNKQLRAAPNSQTQADERR